LLKSQAPAARPVEDCLVPLLLYSKHVRNRERLRFVLKQAALRGLPFFGLRKTFYKWRQRYHQHGDAGLADRARAPRRSPQATPAEVVSKILYLRQHYHFGPGKIADYLTAILTRFRFNNRDPAAKPRSEVADRQ
jgi:hypothetical protein